jgi:large subunit ribosomal protein L6
MSRIGKKPIEIPKNVTVEIKTGIIKVKGPKGELSWNFPEGINVSLNGETIFVKSSGDSKIEKALHGLTRSLINNMIIGVSTGYQRVLEIVGVGYKAQVSGNKLILSLGFSHPIEYQLPQGITATVDAKQIQITLNGIDKQQLGHVASSLRSLRSPDAYKGKGIRYKDERLKLKVGKAGKK